MSRLSAGHDYSAEPPLEAGATRHYAERPLPDHDPHGRKRQAAAQPPGSRDSLASAASGRRSRTELSGRGGTVPVESTSAGSDKQAGRGRQQLLDKWRLDARNPVYGQEDGVSPNKPYGQPAGGVQQRPPSPQRSRLSAAHPLEQTPAIDLVGELFNFTSIANQAPRFEPGAPLPAGLPEWHSKRPFLSGRHLYNSAVERPRVDEEAEPLDRLTRQSQDSLIVDDLLSTFMGLDGRFIRVRLAKRAGGLHLTHALDCAMDASLRDLALRLLPLSESVVVVERFVETRSAFEWGRVCHALCGALRELLDDWRLLVTQLEHQFLTGRLTLPSLWYHCQKPLTSLQLVASLAGEAAARKLRGAGLLNLLHQKAAAVTGDEEASAQVQRLLQAATRPYFAMLQLWLRQGVLDDPYAEFMVQEDKSVGPGSINERDESAYWTDRYRLRARAASGGGAAFQAAAAQDAAPDVPAFLDACKDAILTTGKYLNMIRECGREVPAVADERPLEYDKEQSYLGAVRSANRAASAAVLTLMKEDMELPAVLLALKHYFLLDRGDLLTSFLDTAEDEMAKPLQKVSLPRLQALLDLAVRSSSGVAEPKGEELFCTIDTRRLQPMLLALAPKNIGRDKHKHVYAMTPQRRPAAPAEEDGYALTTQQGREVFMLGFKVRWPLNVVVSANSMNTYQLIFRHLFELKCVERELTKVWKVYQRARGVASDPEGGLKRAHGLCQRMMHFFHQYLLYVTFEVLEPLWLSLQANLASAATLDEVIEHHRAFLNRSLAGTVLRSKMVRNLTELKVLVYDFSAVSQRLDVDPDALAADPQPPPGKPAAVTQGRRRRASAAAVTMRAVLAGGAFPDEVRGLDRRFDASLSNFIAGLEEVHRAVAARADSSREEAESLLNLMARLDFNGYFAAGRQRAGAVQA